MSERRDHDDEVEELRQKLREAEELLRRREEEIGYLRLQIDTLAMVDVDTGLLNRPGILDSVETALQRLDRHDERFCLLAIQLPPLAEIAATQPACLAPVLQHVAALLLAALRAVDRVGRVADDTFVICAPLTEREDFAPQLNRLRSILDAAPLDAGDESYEPEPRFSVVVVSGSTSAGADELLNAALRGLSRATDAEPSVLRL